MSLEGAAKLLWVQIPDPPPQRAKPAQSWRLLKVGQYLTSLDPINLSGQVLPTGTLFQVTHVDSLGAKLTHNSVTLPWSNPEWKSHWARARKPKKTKT